MGVKLKMLNLNKIKICLFPWTGLPSGRLRRQRCRPLAGPGCAVCTWTGQGPSAAPSARLGLGGCRAHTVLSLPVVCFSAARPRLQEARVTVCCPGFCSIHPLTEGALGAQGRRSPGQGSSTICLERHHLVETGTPTPVSGLS